MINSKRKEWNRASHIGYACSQAPRRRYLKRSSKGASAVLPLLAIALPD